ncbi:RHS repeat domain-containing protein [Granulicella arctica]|uniref:RHS repeat domain-containing protein n=1 Tax=Granulicella arctica TaxID=940613 RepID=UPI0021E0E8B6|nr:RHS repeat-associated core domain-containing protein [Granulicella arctica]
MITRRNFGKLGMGLAATSRFSPFLLVSSADAQGHSTTGEGADIRRVGVRSNGAYWGHGGEKIDLLSGNLSYSMSLLRAMSRSCSVPVSLTYNSQIWKQGLAGSKSYGSDSCVGYAWRLHISSVIPETNGTTASGFTFVDGSGAEYRMTQSGNVWRSLNGHYVTWDPAQSTLWLANGSSMTFGSVAGPHEDDAGTMYPTLIQDTNGNQIVVSYLAGIGQTGSNSSGRISQIQDARAGFAGDGQFSYIFMYSSGQLPRLHSIVNTVGSLENYSFSYVQQQVSSPFAEANSVSIQVTMLASVTDGTGLKHIFEYNLHGELTQGQKPQGGVLGWDYRTYSFHNGRAIREVSSRSLLDPHSPSNSHTHSFDRDPSDSGEEVHSSAIVSGPTVGARKIWSFSSASGSAHLGHALSVSSLSGAKVARQKSFAWSNTDTGIPYISNQTTVLDPGTAGQKTSSHQISRDAYGNLASHELLDYDKSASPARTIKHTHVTDQAYLARHILNLRNSTEVQGGGKAVNTRSLKYDTTPIIDRPGLTKHDSTTFNVGNALRGNITESYVGGVYRRVQYDITGTPSVIQDSTQGQISLVPAEDSNNTRLGIIIPNSNENLAMQMGYSGGKLTTVTRPNGNQTALSYDSLGRPATTADSNGRLVTFGYDNGPSTVTSSLNGRWRRAIYGGFGQVIKTEKGDESGTHSLVLNTYGPAANAPMGNLVQTSLPQAPGDEPQWMNTAYDDLGRKISQDSVKTGAPTTFSYSGNSVKIASPSGRWKKVFRNATGQIQKVVMPDASNTTTVETQYSYNALGKLISVTMPRAGATQTRSFSYDSGGRVTQKHHPESGLKNLVYNQDGTLASTMDAKGQSCVYTRDANKRITLVNRVTAKGDPLPNESYSYYYDSNSFDSAFSKNTQGRIAAVQWGNANTLPGLMTEMYSYTVSGQLAAKRLRVNRGGNNADLELHITYDGEGRVASVTYPFGDPTLSYTYDSMGRLSGVSTASDATVKDVAYDSSGNLTSMKLYAKNIGQYLIQGYQYNTRNRATRLIAAPADPTSGGGQLPTVDLAYTYRSNDGKVISETDNITGTSVSYGYDSQDRLAAAVSSDGAWGLGYTYDEFGNRTSQTLTQGRGYSQQVVYDPANNRIVDSKTDYDASGNLVQLPYMQMKYDANNRLTRLESPSGVEHFGYDYKNLRVWKVAPDGTESFDFYSGTINLATYILAKDKSGNLAFSVAKTDIYFGRRLAQSAGDVVVTDRLGSTRAWSAKKGAKTANYMPFGEKIKSQDDERSKFDGYEDDVNTDLKYAEQRYYSSTLGRFMSPDPYEGSANLSSPESWNRYAFVANDPINRVDPHGLIISGTSGPSGDPGNTGSGGKGGGGDSSPSHGSGGSGAIGTNDPELDDGTPATSGWTQSVHYDSNGSYEVTNDYTGVYGNTLEVINDYSADGTMNELQVYDNNGNQIFGGSDADFTSSLNQSLLSLQNAMAKDTSGQNLIIGIGTVGTSVDAVLSPAVAALIAMFTAADATPYAVTATAAQILINNCQAWITWATSAAKH